MKWTIIFSLNLKFVIDRLKLSDENFRCLKF